MKRWINTKVVIDILTGKVLEREGYWYDGKLALCTTPPTVEVTDWAFYDDGTEAGSVIIGSKNTNPTLDVDTIYLVRFGIEETSGNTSKNTAPQLQYNLNSGGWNNVTATSAVVQSVATANIADGADTTQRMTSFTYDSTNEFFDEVNGIAGESGKADLASNGAEALFSVQILSGDVANNDTIVLRVVDSNNSDALYDVYNQTDPTVTVSEGGAVTVNVGMITATATPYSTTVSGKAIIAAGLIVAAAILYSPTVGSFQTVQAGMITASSNIYSTTQSGKAVVTAGLITGTATPYAPSVSSKANITAGLITGTAMPYAVTVILPGGITVNVGLITASSTLYSPSVVAEAIVQAGLITGAATPYGVTVTGEALVTAGLITAAATLYAPTVVTVGGDEDIRSVRFGLERSLRQHRKRSTKSVKI